MGRRPEGRRGCRGCRGGRLRPESRAVVVGEKSIVELAAMTVAAADAHIRNLELPGSRGIVASEVRKELGSRLGFLRSVGLDEVCQPRQ